MIGKLSNNQHEVITGFCLVSHEKQLSRRCKSIVHFDVISAEEIAFYIDTFSPYDKAGAYGIQEWIGTCKIKRIEGSYLNIMGLPMNMIYEELLNW